VNAGAHTTRGPRYRTTFRIDVAGRKTTHTVVPAAAAGSPRNLSSDLACALTHVLQNPCPIPARRPFGEPLSIVGHPKAPALSVGRHAQHDMFGARVTGRIVERLKGNQHHVAPSGKGKLHIGPCGRKLGGQGRLGIGDKTACTAREMTGECFEGTGVVADGADDLGQGVAQLSGGLADARGTAAGARPLVNGVFGGQAGENIDTTPSPEPDSS